MSCQFKIKTIVLFLFVSLCLKGQEKKVINIPISFKKGAIILLDKDEKIENKFIAVEETIIIKSSNNGIYVNSSLTEKEVKEEIEAKKNKNGNLIRTLTNMILKTNKYVYSINFYFSDKINENNVFLLKDYQAISQKLNYKKTPPLVESNKIEPEIIQNNKNKIVEKIKNNSKEILSIYDISNNIDLQFNSMFNDNYKIYMKFTIKNESNLDYEIANLNIKKIIKIKDQGSTTENKMKYPYLDITNIKTVLKESEEVFILEFDKYTLNPNEYITLFIKEKQGNRDLKIRVNSKFFNNSIGL